MLEDKNKVENEEEIVEIEDVDVGLKPKHVEMVKRETKKKVKEQHVLNPEQQKLFAQMMKAADMPVKMTDKDFKLGKNELDIRGLSKENKEQMFFRTLVLNSVNLKEISTTLIDILRALFVLADALGVKDIIEKTDEIIEKMNLKVKSKLDKKEKEPDVKEQA